MSTTNFTSGTVIASDWLNDADKTVYKSVVNVKQAPYNATGNGSTDDTAAIQAAIDANPGKIIFLPRGSYSVNELIVSGDNTTIDLGGGSLVVRSNNVNCITFKPTTAGTTAAFLNGCSIKNGYINMVSFPNSTGAGVELRQCNGFTMENVVFYDADFQVYGGQLSRANGCSFYASSGTYKGVGSALVHFREAPYGSGLYQPCYTFDFGNFRASSSKLRDANFRIYNADGVFIHDGYTAFGFNANVLVLGERDGGYVSSSGIYNCYLDSGNSVTGTINGVELRTDAYTNFLIYEFSVRSCNLGNGPGIGIHCTKTQVADLNITNNWIGNYTLWGINVDGGTTAKVNISGNIFNNNGSGGTSGMIRLKDGQSYNLVGNTFTNVLVVLLNASGTWVTGNITGNVNNSTVADFNNIGATYTHNLHVSGNTSRYAFPGTQYSWVGVKSVFTNYADNAAALAGGLIAGQIYQTSGALKVVT